MKNIYFLISLVFLFSCNEVLIKKPDNLISKEKMIDVLNDLAILNAAKSTDMSILRKNNIEPMQYIYTKYGIDSIQFVESDRYYASIPDEYEAIYTDVEARLEKEKNRMDKEKKMKDSIDMVERAGKKDVIKKNSKKSE